MSARPGWCYPRAFEVCAKVQSGGTPKSGFTAEADIPFLKVYNLVDQKVDFLYRPQYVSRSIHSGELSKSIAYPGDVLMNIVGPPLGKVAIVPDQFPEWNLNQALTIFRPSSAVTTKWLYHFLCGGESVLSLINETRGSAGQVNISLSQCRDFVIPVPPAAEQRRIVAKLDALTARTARARSELDRVPVLAEHQRQSVLRRAIDACIGGAGWTDFGSILVKLTSGSRDWAKFYDQGDAVFVLAGNIRPMKFDPTPKRYVDPPRHGPDAIRSRVENNDLMLTIVGAGTGDLCRAVGVSGDYYVCQSVALLRLKDNAFSEFFELWFQSAAHGRADIDRAMYGAARPHLGFDDIKGFKVPVISTTLAQSAVATVRQQFAEIDRLVAEAAAARRLLDRLDQAILTKAFLGELVPQDPADEPASVLLDRIRAERAAMPDKGRRGRRAEAA